MTKFDIKKLITTKPMKIKLSELFEAQEALMELSNQKLQAVLSYKIALVMKNVEKLLEPVDELRIKKIEEYGTPAEDKDGNKIGGFTIKPNDIESMKKFHNYMKEVGKGEVEINIPDIKIGEFPADVMLAPKNLGALSWLIKE